MAAANAAIQAPHRRPSVMTPIRPTPNRPAICRSPRAQSVKGIARGGGACGSTPRQKRRFPFAPGSHTCTARTRCPSGFKRVCAPRVGPAPVWRRRASQFAPLRESAFRDKQPMGGAASFPTSILTSVANSDHQIGDVESVRARSRRRGPWSAARRGDYFHVKEDADRRRPRGRDAGRGAVDGRVEEFDFESRAKKQLTRQHLSRQGHAGRTQPAGRLRRIWRQPPRLPGLQRNPPRLLPDPSRRPRSADARSRRGRRRSALHPAASGPPATNRRAWAARTTTTSTRKSPGVAAA